MYVWLFSFIYLLAWVNLHLLTSGFSLAFQVYPISLCLLNPFPCFFFYHWYFDTPYSCYAMTVDDASVYSFLLRPYYPFPCFTYHHFFHAVPWLTSSIWTLEMDMDQEYWNIEMYRMTNRIWMAMLCYWLAFLFVYHMFMYYTRPSCPDAFYAFMFESKFVGKCLFCSFMYYLPCSWRNECT